MPVPSLRRRSSSWSFAASCLRVYVLCALCVLFGSKALAQTVPITHIVPDGKPHKFELKEQKFFIDNEPTMLVAGEMHFARVLAEDWETRIKQAKAMGLNTISFYLFWNQVEGKEGQYDFTGVNDVRRVLKLCRENGMWAILRPGPYCCAEVEYGGIPYWTLKHPEVKIRTKDPQFLAWCKRYLEQVYKQVGDLDVSKGGPLLMTQIDNEYGIVADGNNDYMIALQKIFKEVGFTGQLMVCDPGSVPANSSEWTRAEMRLPGVLMGRNGFGRMLAQDDAAGEITQKANGDFPIFVPELYTAWFSGWGGKIEKRYPIPNSVNWLNYMFDKQHSFCLFLVFGGTNYGFYNGCNEYQPVQTSYDYDAPVDEAGRTTERYRVYREMFSKRTGITPPPVPPEPAVAEIPAITLDQKTPLVDWLPATPTRTSAKPLSMEDLDQDYGFVLYRKKFADGIKGQLELRRAMDYTVVMANGKTVGKSFIGYGLDSNKMTLNETGQVTLDLLVYNLGRISVPVSMKTQERARKGLIDGAYLDGQELSGWEIYSLPMKSIDNLKPSTAAHTGPTFYHGTFTAPAGADQSVLPSTFLDMRNWGLGAVWVNGHNLGRFWDHGGLRSLYLPGHWLKQGANDIVVLELHDAPKAPQVSGATHIIEEPAVPFALRLDHAIPGAPI